MPRTEPSTDPEIRVVAEPDPSTERNRPRVRDATDRHFERNARRGGFDRPADRGRVADDDEQSYGARVQRRIGVFRRQLGDAQTEIAALRNHNQQLARQLGETSASALSSYVEAAKAKTDEAAKALEAAHTEGDGKAIVEATRKLAAEQSALTNAETSLRHAKNGAARTTQSDAAPPRGATVQPASRRTEATEDWLADNPWFETDPEAKELMLAQHRRLIGQGVKPDTKEYFRGLDKFARANLPEHFEEPEERGRQTSQDPDPDRGRRRDRDADLERRARELDEDEPEADDDAEPARRAPVSGVRRTVVNRRQVTEVRLSKDEMEMAGQMGLTAKQYATHKAKLAEEGRI